MWWIMMFFPLSGLIRRCQAALDRPVQVICTNLLSCILVCALQSSILKVWSFYILFIFFSLSTLNVSINIMVYQSLVHRPAASSTNKLEVYLRPSSAENGPHSCCLSATLPTGGGTVRRRQSACSVKLVFGAGRTTFCAARCSVCGTRWR